MNQIEFKRRTKQLGLAVIRMTEKFPETRLAWVVKDQILRSALSVGANYRRAACPFSLPCTSQGKILSAAVSTVSRSLSSASLSSSAALPLESGCKGTDFFRFRNFYTILFCRNFSGSCLTR